MSTRASFCGSRSPRSCRRFMSRSRTHWIWVNRDSPVLPGLVDQGMPSSSASRSSRRASSCQHATGSVSASGRFTNGEEESSRRSQIHTYGSSTTRKVRFSRRIRFQGARCPGGFPPLVVGQERGLLGEPAQHPQRDLLVADRFPVVHRPGDERFVGHQAEVLHHRAGQHQQPGPGGVTDPEPVTDGGDVGDAADLLRCGDGAVRQVDAVRVDHDSRVMPGTVGACGGSRTGGRG